MRDSRPLSQRPMIAPARPPAPASIRLSVSICRTRRRRPAPSAARSASSRCRTVARTISRFTTFTQATSSTSVTSSRNTPATSGLLFAALGSGRARRSGIARARTVLFVSGYCCSSWRASTSSAACACGSETPGFSLPITRSSWLSRRSIGLLVALLGEDHAERHVRVELDQRVDTVEAFGDDPRHGERLAVDEHRASDHRRVAVEASLPVRPPEHDHRIRAERRALPTGESGGRAPAPRPSMEKKFPVTYPTVMRSARLSALSPAKVME